MPGAAKVLVEQHDRARVVAINRPERRNCVDAETAQALCDAVVAFRDDASADVLVITGGGEQAFCSGADLRDVAGLAARPGAWQHGPMGFTHLLDVGKPTIAAINGYCTAGGLEVACWCDFRVADAAARFGVLNRRWGVPLIDGGTQRLPRIVGLGNALYLAETGVLIDAEHAARIGLVQEVVDAGKALERALEIARALGGYPQTCLRNDRQAMLEGLALPLDRGLANELAIHRDAITDPEMARGLERFRAGDRPAPLRPPARRETPQ